ncbi:MAG: hypothetical protein Q4D07_08515 [Selenomonadaceae bacterium]|nr:hypothetical protein [Selenomonadaceae bacterium]
MKRPIIKTESRRLLLSLGLLMVLSFCAFLTLVWEPQQTELSEMALRQAEVRTVRMEMENFNRRHPELEDYRGKLAVRQERAERLFLTDEGDADGFFQSELTGMAESAGLTIEQMAAGDDKEAAEGGKGEKRMRPRQCRFTLRGSYRAVTEFLTRLEQGERFAAVKSWKLKRSSGQSQAGDLTLELLLEAYELKQVSPR